MVMYDGIFHCTHFSPLPRYVDGRKTVCCEKLTGLVRVVVFGEQGKSSGH